MRILWASNAPWAPTGYGGQTALVIERLRRAGHEVAVAANFGLQAARIDWEGFPIFPSGTDAYGNDILPAQYFRWTAGKGWLLTLYDAWVWKPSYFEKVHVSSWTPVDHYPVPPGVAGWAKDHETIAMSRFGEKTLREKGIASTYIPHAIDTKVFAPGSRVEARASFDIPADAYVVMMNAANKGAHPPRKAWSENFGALSVFMGKHPDVHVYLHTDMYGVGGVDLSMYAGLWGLPPERTHFVAQLDYKEGGIPPSKIAAMYRAADVLLAVSMGEGFGIPTIEAQACGTPVIVSNFSASPELVGAGWKADGQPEVDPLQGSYFFRPNIGSIVDCLEQSYAARGSESVAAAAVAKAAEYDIDRIFSECWLPYLDRLADLLKPALPRRERRAKRQRKAA